MLRVLLATPLLLVACTKRSEKYCALHPEDTAECADTSVDAGMACTNDQSCTASGARVCDTDTRTCVECTVERTDACDPGQACVDNACGPCTEHAQCGSGVCRANGSCADEDDVAYADADGNNGGECTRSSPCNDLEKARQTDKPVILVTGAVSSNGTVVFGDGRTEVYGAPGASISRRTMGAILQVENAGTELGVYGLRITGATSAAAMGHAVQTAGNGNPTLLLDRVVIHNNAGSGVRASDNATVIIRRSIIAQNQATGVYLANGSYEISNTLIVQNGNVTTSPGGAFLNPARSSRFEFNTVADNISMGGAGAYRGVTCVQSSTVLANSIITSNQVGSDCTVRYSLFSAGSLPSGGTNNLEGAPQFIAANAPTDATYYRLQASSDAIDEADPAASEPVDLDGTPRPVGNRRDMGAVEAVP